MIPKQPRQEDSDYLNFIRQKACLCMSNTCWEGKTFSHHIISRGAWGSDYRAIPLCLFHHIEAEQKSLEYMEKTYNFNTLDEIIKLLSEYLKQKTS